MYHSHHNATDQVGRGLLGALRRGAQDEDRGRHVRPRVRLDLERRARRLHDQRPRLPGRRAGPGGAVGETVRVRFMNEGIMMHPWHSHGYRMQRRRARRLPARRRRVRLRHPGRQPGRALGREHRPRTGSGIWAFHCHILPHVEGADGMFGMVTTLIVVPTKEDVDAIVAALLAVAGRRDDGHDVAAATRDGLPGGVRASGRAVRGREEAAPGHRPVRGLLVRHGAGVRAGRRASGRRCSSCR